MSEGLVITGVSKSFGGVRVLNDVSLTVRPAMVTALIGPNGAGKSTLANIVSGFERPDQGRIEVAGRDLTGQRPELRASAGLARTFQNLEIFKGLTVLENVMMGAYGRGGSGLVGALLAPPGARREERRLRTAARELLERFGLADSADVPVESLPFGQAKLLELARVLALDPHVVVLDEPAAGLPATSARMVGEQVTSMARAGVAVLLIEHNMQLVMEVSDHIAVLDHGELLTVGDPAEVRADPRVIEAYLGEGTP
ncbi:ABC transporter ATP-binding protein [Microbispora hainanensis]|uniref:ABC transporter ATP-binding protein n=1 Tax=Microbispora hainanensis TaxID=568844 RepID=UPI002E2B2E1C|nr:ABC transporter ATP-binding protein [Microbispora hainanensis]